MINREYKVLFIHVIKTGISIATALKHEAKQNHSRASKIKKTLERCMNSYFKFAFCS